MKNEKGISLIILVLIIVLILILGAVLTIVLLKGNDTKDISDYEVYPNSRTFEYRYTFNDEEDNSIVYYNDQENNCIYIKICTYNFMYKPIDKFYENNKIKSPEDLIKDIYFNSDGKIEIYLNMKNYEKKDQMRTESIEGESILYPNYTKDDVTIYLKLNNITASQIELNIGSKKVLVNPSKPRSLELIASEYFSNPQIKDKYFSFCSNNKYGLIDRNGEMFLDFISDKEILFNDNLNLLVINKGGLDYLADFSGNIISEGYEDLVFINNIVNSGIEEREYYSDHVIVSELKDEDKNNEERLKINFASDRKKFGLLDKTGDLVVPILCENYNDIFYEAKFCFVKSGDLKYIITDFNGKQIGNNTYSDIRRATDGYYIAELSSTVNATKKEVIINTNGEEISDYYTESISLANTELLLFETGLPLISQKILDKNFKVRMEGIDIDRTEKNSNQPYLNRGGALFGEFKVDGVTIKELNGVLKLLHIDDEKITIQCEDNGIIKVITVKNGKIIEN